MAQTKIKLNSTAPITSPPSDNLFEPIHFNDVFQYIVIYIFAIHDSKHDGLLKIGKTTIKINRPPQELPPNCTELLNAAKNRIKGYTNTAGIEFDLLYADIAIKDKSKIVADIDDNTFDDKDVHDILLNSGYERAQIAGTTAQEWFKVDLSKAVEAINSVKRGEKVVSTKFVEFPFRPEQNDAIDKTVNHFQKGGNAFLWNAKMRFGKTVCALQVIRKMNFHKTIIITHRPVVDEEWEKSFYKVFNVKKEKFDYYDKTKNFAKRVANERHFIYFASIQDLRGSKVKEDNDEIRYKKNKKIFDLKWDCIIVDEAHEGTTTDIGKNLIDSLKNENTKTLSLSGTPFNIIDKYDETNVYTWDYVMEQRAKANWIAQHHDDLNPYFNLPKMNIFTYNLVDKFKKYATENDDVYFNFAEFFRTDDRGKFVNEKDIKSFLDLLVDENPDSNYPYSREDWRKLFKHSLWMIPGVKEGKALSKLLKKHKVFKHFGIVNVAGDGDDDEVSTNALTAVQEAIKKNDYTITLSCGKLTMGVTVPEWSAVFMLYGSSIVSAASYMQTIFRVQSPCIINGTVKTDCFVFDFAPNRTLKMVAASAMLSYRAQDNKNTQRQNLDALLQFFPVIAIAGSQMSTYNVDKLMQQLKRAQADKVTEKGFDSTILYDEKLLNLSDKEINDFKDLRKILGVTAAKSKIKINSSEGIHSDPPVRGGGTSKTTEQKEHEKKLRERRNAIAVLRGVSIRMPLLIYGADIPIDEDFTIDMFLDDKIVDQESWQEFMPKGITKKIFKDKIMQYYDRDIFVAAGRNIRQETKRADNLPPLERVDAIIKIFSYFKNPDKETVLTPWNVVDLHMSSAFDQNFFDEDKKILEINSKSGLYPLWVARKIYCNVFGNFSAGNSSNILYNYWLDIVRDNIFVICKTPMAVSITRRTLLGFRNGVVNAIFYDNIINVLKFKRAKFILDVQSEKFWNKGNKEMKFDAVVGNPPYQSAAQGDNKNYTPPVYPLFMEAAFRLAPITSLITPARFLFNAGGTKKEFNKRILNDEHFKIVKYFPDSSELFPTSDIKGGVIIFVRDNKNSFEPIKFFFAFDELKFIHQKVVINNEDFESLSKIVHSRTTYTLTLKFHKDNPTAINLISKGHALDFSTNIIGTFKKLFHKDQPNDGYDYVQIYGRENNKRVCKWFRRDWIDNPDLFGKYKVLVPDVNSSGEFGEILSLPFIGSPIDGSTETFITVGAFDTEDEAQACLKYIQTKFARAMLGILKVTQHNPPATWAKVPMQDFTAASDIDWSKTVAEIDAQLYRKYNLTEEEIKFIESHVKAMD